MGAKGYVGLTVFWVQCRAILGLAANQTAGLPALVDVQIKPFPWPAGTLDIGAAAAAAAFNLLIVFAFLSPTRGMVAAIVREKELRLREGMRILGLKVCLLLTVCGRVVPSIPLGF